MRPIIATFRSVRDKENILRHASSSRSLKKDGIFVTEDYGNKVRKPKNPNQSPTKTSEVSWILCKKLIILFSNLKLNTGCKESSCSYSSKNARKYSRKFERWRESSRKCSRRCNVSPYCIFPSFSLLYYAYTAAYKYIHFLSQIALISSKESKVRIIAKHHKYFLL